MANKKVPVSVVNTITPALVTANPNSQNPNVITPQQIATQTKNMTEAQEKSPQELRGLNQIGAAITTATPAPGVIALGDTPQGQKFGESKYDTNLNIRGVLGIDEVRGQRQTNADKWANGLVKFAGKTGTVVAGGTVGTLYGIGSMITEGKGSSFYNNSFAELLEDANEAMDGALPHYYTEAERTEQSLWKKMATANFFSDQMLNGLSFISGAILTEMATAGLGSLMLGNTASRSARMLKRLNNQKQMTSLAKQYGKIGNRGAWMDAGKLVRQTVTGAGYEAGVEARHHYDRIYEALTQDWEENNPGIEMPDEVRAGFSDIATNQSNGVFLGNLALVAGSNALMLGKLYGPGAALRSKFSKSMQKVFPGYGRSAVQNEAGEFLARYTRPLGKLGEKIGMGPRAGKILGRGSRALMSPLYEGFVEEGGQSTLSEIGYDYAMLKYSSESKKAKADLISSIGYGFQQTYGTTEGQTEIAMGALLGLIGAKGAYTSRVQTEQVQELLAKANNKYPDLATAVKEMSKFMDKDHVLQRLMDQHLMDGNIAAYKDLENDSFFSYVKARHDAGYFEDIIDDAKAVKEMTNEEFMESFNYKEGDFKDDSEITSRKNKVANDVITRANKYRDALNTADQALGSRMDDPIERMTDENYQEIREQVAHELAVAENVEERMESLKTKMSEMTNGTVVAQSIEGEQISSGIGYKGTSKKGAAVSNITPFVNMQEGTLGSQLQVLQTRLEENDNLREDDPDKLSDPDVIAVKQQMAAIQMVIAQSGANTSLADVSREELLFLQNAMSQLDDLAEKDPSTYLKVKDEVVQMLQDMRHLRARRQTAFERYNSLFTEEGQRKHFQRLERYADQIEKQDAVADMRGRQMPEEVIQLAERYGTDADLYFSPTNEKSGLVFDEKGLPQNLQGNELIVRFDEQNNLYNVKTGDPVSLEELDGMFFRTAVTDKQKKAQAALEAIERLKQDKVKELTKTQKDIEDITNDVFDLLLEVEEKGYEQLNIKKDKRGRTYGVIKGRKGRVSINSIRDVHKKAVDQINTGERLIIELQEQAAALQDSLEFLSTLAETHYNPRTGEFDISLDNRYGAEMTNRISAMSELGILDLVEDPTNYQEAREWAELMRADVDEFVGLIEPNTRILQEKIQELSEYKDVLEGVLLENLAKRNLSTNRYTAARTFDDMLADALIAIDESIAENDGLNEENPQLDAIKRLRGTLVEFPNYRTYRDFVNQNPAFFTELGPFLNDIEAAQKNIDDNKFLRAELKLTEQELDQLGTILDQFEAQKRQIEDTSLADAIIEHTKFEDAYYGIMDKLLQMEEVLNQTTEDVDSNEDTDNGDILTTLQGLSSDLAQNQDDMSESVVGPTMYKPSWDVGFDKTAGNMKVSQQIYNSLKDRDPESLTAEEKVKLKIATHEMRFFDYTSGYIPYGKSVKGRVTMLAVKKGQTIEGIEQEELDGLFVDVDYSVKKEDDGTFTILDNNGYKVVGGYETQETAEQDAKAASAPIKFVVAYANSLRPVRLEEYDKQLITSSMMTPARYKPFEGNSAERFSNLDNLSDSDIEYLQKLNIQERRAILDNEGTTKITYDITGTSAGVPFLEGTTGNRPSHNVRGRVFLSGAKKNTIAGANIEVASKPVINLPGGGTMNTRPGNAFIRYGGTLYPLRYRTLESEEIDQVVNLVRLRESTIQDLMQTDPTLSRFQALTQAETVLEDQGVTSKISDLINNLIYNGKLTEDQAMYGAAFQFYFDKKRKGYAFGEDGFISVDQIRAQDPTAMSAFRTFLSSKTHQVNKQNLNGSKDLSKRKEHEKVVLNDDLSINQEGSRIGENRYRSYEEFLLDGDAPVLGTAVQPKSSQGTLGQPQVAFKYMKLKQQNSKGKVKKSNITSSETNDSWTDLQTKQVNYVQSLIDKIIAGDSFYHDDQMMNVKPTKTNILGLFYDDMSEMVEESAKYNTVDDIVEKFLKPKLEAYKKDRYQDPFASFILGKARKAPLDSTPKTETKARQAQQKTAQPVDEYSSDFQSMMSAVVDLESDAQELNDALKEDNNPFKDLDVDDINLDEGVNMLLTEMVSQQLTSEEINEQESILKEMFPNANVKKVADYIKTKDGKAQARLERFGQITLSNLAESGALYHEAWHNTSLYLLGKKDLDGVYGEVRNNNGKGITYKGETKKFSEFTDKEADEYLAEEFRKYVLTNGKHKIGSTKVKTFFDFMRDVLNMLNPFSENFGRTRAIFNDIRKGRFADVTPQFELDGKETVNKAVFSGDSQLDNDMGLTMHRYWMNELFFNDDAPVTIAELENIGDTNFDLAYNTRVKEAYIKALKAMSLDYNVRIKKFPEHKEGLEQRRSLLVKNYNGAIAVHRAYLRSLTPNLVVTNENIVEEEYARLQGSNMYDAMEHDSKDMASNAIKLLVSSTPGTTNTTGLVGAVNYTEKMNYLHNLLAGTLSYEQQISTLKRFASTQPWIQDIINKLEKDVSDDMNYEDLKFRTMFKQQFAKAKNDFALMLTDSEGNLYSIDPNKQKTHDAVMNIFTSNLHSKKGLVETKDGRFVFDITHPIKLEGIKLSKTLRQINNKRLIDGSTVIGVLDALGVTFTNPDAVAVEENMDTLIDAAYYIVKDIVEKTEGGELIGANVFDRNNIDARSRLSDLIQLEVDTNNSPIDLSHLNFAGKMVHGITLNTFLNVATSGAIMPYHGKDNTYSRNSRWKDMMLLGDKFGITVLEGMTNQTTNATGSRTSALGPADQRAVTINNTLNGVAPLLRAADQRVEYGFAIPDGKSYVENNTSIEDLKPTILGYIADEISVAAEFNRKGKGKDFRGYKEKAGGLRIFNNILQPLADSNSAFKTGLSVALKGSQQDQADFLDSHKEKIFNSVKAYLKEESAKNLRTMQQMKIAELGNKEFKLHGIDNQTANRLLKRNTDASKEYSYNELQKLSDIFTMHYFVNNIEQFKVFLGDPAFYKSLFKRTKGAAGTKKVAGNDAIVNGWLQQEGNGRIDGKEIDGTDTINIKEDPITASLFADEYAEANPNNADAVRDAYNNIDEADAMVYSPTGSTYRELLVRVGDWSDLQEEYYQKTQRGENLTVKELAAFPIIKPQYFGPQVTSNGQYAPLMLKFALAPIFPQMLERDGQPTLMKKMYDDMVDTKTGMLGFPSAAKLGSRVNKRKKTAEPMFSNGIITDINPDNTSVIDYNFFGIQVDISPVVKNKTTVGTQQRPLVMVDSYEAGVPVDFQASSTQAQRQAAWNNLSPEGKLKKSKRHREIVKYNNLINAFTKNQLQSVLDTLGLEKKGDKYELKDGDFGGFANQLISEMRKRELPQNIIDGIEYLLNTNDPILFDVLLNKNRIENLLFALVRNRAVSHKFKGDMKVQMPETGMQIQARYQDPNDGKLRSAGLGNLQAYRKGPNKTISMEVYMPHIYKEYLGKNLTIKQDGIYDDQNNKIAGKELLEIIGFRIPTDGLHSIDALIVKGFLPAEYGSTIMIPPELVVKAGGDFDIDKLTLYLPSYKKEGDKLVKRELINASTETDAGLKKYYNDRYGSTFNFAEQLDRDLAEVDRDSSVEVDNAVDKLLEAIFGDNMLEYTEGELNVLERQFSNIQKIEDPALRAKEAVEYYKKFREKVANLPSFEEFAEQYRGVDPLVLEHPGSLQNEIMGIQRDLILAPDNFGPLVNPISINRIREEALTIRALKGEPANENDVDYATMISFNHVSKVAEDFWSAAVGVGVAARHVTHNVKSQLADVRIHPNARIEVIDVKDGTNEEMAITLNFEGFTEGESISIGLIEDLDGNRISKTLSGTVNGFIDVANDPYIFSLNLNKDTANAGFALLRSGLPLETASRFLNQPIILDYIREKQIANSRILKSKLGRESEYNKDIITKVRDKYQRDLPKGKTLLTQTKFNKEMLTDMIGKTPKEMDSSQKNMQIQALQDFLRYDEIGNQLGKLLDATAADTTAPKNRYESIIMQTSNSDILNSGFFINTDRLFTDTFMGGFAEVAEESSYMFNDFFINDSVINDLHDIFADPNIRMSTQDRVRAMREVDNDFITMQLQTASFNNQAMSDRIKTIMTGPNSLPSRVEAMKAAGNSNLLINSLTPLLSVERSGELATVDNMKVVTASLDKYTQDMLLDAFYALDTLMQQDLIEFAVLQSGLSNSPLSFINLLPSPLIAKMAHEAIDKYSSNSQKSTDFRGRFFRNNWDKEYIVPTVRSRNIPISSPTASFPFVKQKVDAVSSEEAKRLKKEGKRVPKEVALYKNMGVRDLNGVKMVKYMQVDKLGNGMGLKEYYADNRASVIQTNNKELLVKDVREERRFKDIPSKINLPDLSLKNIRNNKKTAIAVKAAGNLLKSGNYMLPDGTRVVLTRRTEGIGADATSITDKSGFARELGFKNYDALLTNIKSSNVPSGFFDLKNRIHIFDISNVEVPMESIESMLDADDVTVAFSGPSLKLLDGEGVKGPMYQAVGREIEARIDELISNGKRNFVVGVNEGTDYLTLKTLLKAQKDYSNKNIALKIKAVLPYPGFEAAFKDPSEKLMITKMLSKYGDLNKNRNSVEYIVKSVPRSAEAKSKVIASRSRKLSDMAGTIVAIGSNSVSRNASNKGRTVDTIDLKEIKEMVAAENKLKKQSEKCN